MDRTIAGNWLSGPVSIFSKRGRWAAILLDNLLACNILEVYLQVSPGCLKAIRKIHAPGYCGQRSSNGPEAGLIFGTCTFSAEPRNCSCMLEYQ